MKDTLSAKSLHLWARALFGNSANDNFSNPIEAPTGWWKNIVVDRIFIGAGGDEILLGSIVQIAHHIKVCSPLLELDWLLISYFSWIERAFRCLD